MDKIDTMEGLLVHELKDLYSAEKQLMKIMPKVVKKTSSPELKDMFERHMRETEGQLERLDEVFEILGERAKAMKCKGMDGILQEATEIIKQKGTPETLDAAIILAAQKIEHYEIASYGSAATWAEMMGRKDIKKLLGETLDEEEKTDKMLTELAKAGVNPKSVQKSRSRSR